MNKNLFIFGIIGAVVGGYVAFNNSQSGGDGAVAPQASDQAKAAGFSVPVVYKKLDNGLKVVISEDHSIPTVSVAVYYNIGFRIEPKDRTGFAHLFEHMMFQGTKKMPKGMFDKMTTGGGGINNGSTRFDFTNYFEVLPSNQLEGILWVEADRMRGLDLTQASLTNQQGVVKNEVMVNVINRPYGGFPWLDMPQYANKNWYNAHNFYGDLEDLDNATLEDVKDFFDTYYAPNNAVIVVAGDMDPDQTMKWVEQYFSDIPKADVPPIPDLSEPRQEIEQNFTKIDPLAPKPALAFAYHMPDRGTPEYYAMGIIDQMLLQGEDSRLHQALVNEGKMTSSVFGGINMLGNMFNYNGPMEWTSALIHDAKHSSDDIMRKVDAVIVDLQTGNVTQGDIDRSLTKMRSGFYDEVTDAFRSGLFDMLATFALFDDDPARINRLQSEFDDVTPALIQKTAIEFLRSTNRTVLVIEPGKANDPLKAKDPVKAKEKGE